MIFAQAIVFHPYSMEITSLTLGITAAQNCFKISRNHFFWQFQANIMDFPK